MINYCMKLISVISIAAVSVEFISSSYSISEERNLVLMLMLSNPSSTDITLKVDSKDLSAAGMSSLEVL